MSDFLHSARFVVRTMNRFLMVGRRWDVDIQLSLNFEEPDWEHKLRQLARTTNRPRPAQWIDYFLFPKGLYYKKIPQFVVGRPGWDNWLLWYPLSMHIPVVDASSDVLAVHQNHDYSYHSDGEKGVWQGEEAQENYRLHGDKFGTLAVATHVLRSGRLQRNYRAPFVRIRRSAIAGWYRIWFGVLNATRSVRHRLGMRSRNVER